ncbi:MAG: hypothetical protein WKF47_14815 [Geodermatophilaceae bacterium]
MCAGGHESASVTTRDEDLLAAERALQQRAQLSFAAARQAGLPGLFETHDLDGLFAVLTTSPGLSFLNSITGVTSASLDALPRALEVFAAANAPGPSIGTAPWSPASVSRRLEQLGFEPAGERPLAYLKCPAARPESDQPIGEWAVHEAGDVGELDLFIRILLAGYASDPRVCVHRRRAPRTRRPPFRCLARRSPLAAAGLSQHGDSLVIGGAGTLPEARGAGAQSELLRYRVRIAGEQNVHMAVATCAPKTPSARNLQRAGFSIIERRAWRHVCVNHCRAMS